MIFRRVAIGLAAVVLVAAVVAFIVVRQIVFGGTPTIHHTGKGPSLVSSPCATVSIANGTRAFGIDTHNSSAACEAHFLVAGQSVPGTVTDGKQGYYLNDQFYCTKGKLYPQCLRFGYQGDCKGSTPGC